MIFFGSGNFKVIGCPSFYKQKDYLWDHMAGSNIVLIFVLCSIVLCFLGAFIREGKRALAN